MKLSIEKCVVSITSFLMVISMWAMEPETKIDPNIELQLRKTIKTLSEVKVPEQKREVFLSRS